MAPLNTLTPMDALLGEASFRARLRDTHPDLGLFLKAWSRCWQDVGLVPILPLLFRLNGKPLTLDSHFMEEPLYRLHRVPRRMVLKAGRQLGKSVTLAYQGTARSLVLPYFNTIFLSPLYEQIRRFSQNYVKQAVEECVFRDLVKGDGSVDNVLQRTMSSTKSTMYFTFAFNDCSRVRGLTAEAVAIDEVQGMNKEFIPIIMETLSAGRYRLEQYSGTPLTMDNPLEELWRDTSMAEWAIKCRACGKTSLAGFNYDLMKMIGKSGLVCAHCGKPLVTQDGYWHHTMNARRNEAVGYHLPQCIFPMHCQDPEKWAALLQKREKDQFIFMTECLGESWDAGAKLVTKSQLEEACVLPWQNEFSAMLASGFHQRHQIRVLSIDWSGGGAKEESLTAFSILGLTMDGKVEVCWMKKYKHSTDYTEDAARAIQAFKSGLCHYIVHDAAGQGIAREQILMSAGVPREKIIPIAYVSAMAGKTLMRYNPPDAMNARHTYSLVKHRAIVFTCEMIKQGYVRFPQWKASEPCLRDFLALVEETLQTPHKSDIYLINKAQGVPDDMAHSVVMGACALYYHHGTWPDLAATVRGISLRALAEADPTAADPAKRLIQL